MGVLFDVGCVGLLAVGALWLWHLPRGSTFAAEPAVAAVAAAALSAGMAALGFWLVGILLALPWMPCAVARVLLADAVRSGASVVTHGVLLAFTIWLALRGAGGASPEFRLRSFLTYSLEATVFLLSLLVLFLACGSLAREIENRYVFTTLTRPLRRRALLLGKWLGLVALGAIQLAAVGSAVAALAWWLGIAGQRAGDSSGVERVLSACRDLAPEPEVPPEERSARELALLPEDHPERATILRAAATDWRSVEAGEEEVYLFSPIDLGALAGGAARLVIRVNARFGPMRSASDLPIRIELALGPRSLERSVLHHERIEIPLEPTDAPGGRLRLRVRNPDPEAPMLLFSSPEHLEVLVAEGGFAANLARALAMQWLKLAFLAALGVAAASFLGFPVAVLTASVLAGIAASADFIVEEARDEGHASHGGRAPKRERPDVELIEELARAAEAVGQSVARRLVRFSRYEPIPRVADGRVVSWSDLGSCAAHIGLLWSGACLAAGMLLFARRELGRVQL